MIAGSGNLPVEIFKFLHRENTPIFLCLLKGDADPYLYQFPYEEIEIVQLAKLLKILKKQKITAILLAGAVKSRPQLSNLRLDFPTIFALPKLLSALRKGDDALLKAFIRVLESYKFKVIGAQALVPDLLAPKNKILTHKKPTIFEEKDIKLAFEAAKMLGILDIGQGAVAVDGRVVAVEGAEGTDNMLKRIEEMREQNKIPSQGGVLVKCIKPQQDPRADLPTIGVHTVEKIVKAKLSGIAVEAEKSFILEYDQTLKLANENNVFIKTI